MLGEWLDRLDPARVLLVYPEGDDGLAARLEQLVAQRIVGRLAVPTIAHAATAWRAPFVDAGHEAGLRGWKRAGPATDLEREQAAAASRNAMGYFAP